MILCGVRYDGARPRWEGVRFSLIGFSDSVMFLMLLSISGTFWTQQTIESVGKEANILYSCENKIYQMRCGLYTVV